MNAKCKCGKTWLRNVKGNPGCMIEIGCASCGGSAKVKL